MSQTTASPIADPPPDPPPDPGPHTDPAAAVVVGDTPNLVAPPDPGPHTDPAARKAALRRHLLAVRVAMDAEDRARAALAARDHALTGLTPPAGAVVAGYWPIRSEIDPGPLLQALRDRGHPIALPVTPPADARPILTFRLWDGDPDGLAPGPFRTRQPPAHAPAVSPTWILVPLVGFDRRGARLGYGGGYYDRLMATADAVCIGYAHACQEVAPEAGGVPVEPHDRPLDAIITDRGVIRPGAPPTAAAPDHGADD